MFQSNLTRSFGLLEKFLAYKRIKIANKLTPQHLRKGRVLDIGCGVTPLFLLKTEFHKKYGVDLSLKTVICNGDIILKPLDIEKCERLPFDDGFFDEVVMLAVFEHINLHKLEDVLKEVKRILKKGGRLILTTPCPWSNKLLRLMSKVWLISKVEINDHKGGHNYRERVKYLQSAGFNPEKIKTGYFEFFLNSWTYVDKSR